MRSREEEVEREGAIERSSKRASERARERESERESARVRERVRVRERERPRSNSRNSSDATNGSVRCSRDSLADHSCLLGREAMQPSDLHVGRPQIRLVVSCDLDLG